MFGYIQTYKNELKLKDINKYKLYYCGLCKQIQKDYGNFYRLFLSFDCTFLAIYLDDSIDSRHVCDTHCVGCRCAKEIECSPEVMEFAAFINMLLMVRKLNDNHRDDGNVISYVLAKIVEKNTKYHMNCVLHYSLVEKIDSILQTLYDMENSNNYNVDDLCVPFSKLLGIIVAYGKRYIYKIDTEAGNLSKDRDYNIGYYLGRTIYILDAFDDYKADLRHNKFNPFNNYKKDALGEQEWLKKALINIEFTQKKLRFYTNKLELSKNKDIILNVIQYGIANKIQKIIKNRYIREIEKLIKDGDQHGKNTNIC